MSDEVREHPRSGCLIYDSHCRLCVAVKQKLEQRSTTVQFLPYDSQEATDYLGSLHQPGSRPPMAYWIDEKGAVVGGLEAFFPVSSRPDWRKNSPVFLEIFPVPSGHERRLRICGQISLSLFWCE